MKKIFFYFFGVCCMAGNVYAQKNHSFSKEITPLESRFTNLDPEAKPYTYWFWMNGNITKEGITRDLEAMHRVGIGGVFNLEGGTGIPKGPVVYLSPEWAELKSHAIKEAARLGIEFVMHNCPGWSSSGGPWITPEMSMKTLTWSEVTVQGGQTIREKLPQPRANLDYYEDIAILAFPAFPNGKPVGFKDWQQMNNSQFNHLGTIGIEQYDPQQIIRLDDIKNITQTFSPAEQQLNWNAPEGEWIIMRIGYTTSGHRNASAPDTGIGLECDKFDKSAIRFHLNKMMDILNPLIEPYKDQVKIGLEIDSWEAGPQNWTAGFQHAFADRMGYDILPYLPVLTGKLVESTDISERVLWDFRRMQADLLADNYYGEFRTICHELGFLSYNEPYDRGPMEEMQIGARVDGVLGEFWNGLSSIFQNNLMMRRTAKLASSIAHTNGQPIVGAEAYTSEPESGRWQNHPFSLKAVGDKAFTDGINRMVIHRYAQQPHPDAAPGMTLGPWGIHFDRTNTWWEPGKAWLEYLNRCQTMLREGLFVADFAYFTGEKVVGYTPVHRYDLTPQPPQGYDYDLINSESLIRDAKIVNGRLVLPDGMNYAVLVLQDQERMSLEMLKKLHQMIQDGLTVVGTRPTYSLGLKGYSKETEKEYSRICDEIWGSQTAPKQIRKVGKGRIFIHYDIAEVVEEVGLKPDFMVDSESGDAPVRYIHRSDKDREIYFVSNQKRSTENVLCHFRSTGKKPHIWDPVTGKITEMPLYSVVDEYTDIPLTLSPYESVFVVFSGKDDGKNITAIEKNGEILASAQTITTEEQQLHPDVVNNFTIHFWAKPESDAMLNIDNPLGYVGIDWTEYYALYPLNGSALYGEGHAVCGVAVGRNGVALWENANGIPQFVMSSQTPISGWTHIAVRYIDGSPTLFINGKLMCVGARGQYKVHPGVDQVLSDEKASYFNGDMYAVTLVDRGLGEVDMMNLAEKQPDFSTFNAIPTYEFRKMKGKTVLEVRESGEYVWSDAKNRKRKVSATLPEAREVSGTWNVTFPKGLGAPESIKMDSLYSLHKHEIDGVRYFSGTATYQNMFEIPAEFLASDQRIYLDLGHVEVLAEIAVNGKDLGIFWTRPYLADITDVIQPGQNSLSIRVTNLWPNRLIGDEQLPAECEYNPGGGLNGIPAMWQGAIKALPDWYAQGKPKPEGGRIAFSTWQHYSADSPLLESGLIGPVTIRPAKVIEVR